MFDPAVIDALADQLTAAMLDRLEPALSRSALDGWLDTKQAAEYLRVGPDAVHRLTAARKVTFSQVAKGGPMYFRREWLDAYRFDFVHESDPAVFTPVLPRTGNTSNQAEYDSGTCASSKGSV